jgi:hypothetical protein
VSDDDATDGSIDDSEEDNIEGTADTDGLSDGDPEGTNLKSYTLICPALDVVEYNFHVNSLFHIIPLCTLVLIDLCIVWNSNL